MGLEFQISQKGGSTQVVEGEDENANTESQGGGRSNETSDSWRRWHNKLFCLQQQKVTRTRYQGAKIYGIDQRSSAKAVARTLAGNGKNALNCGSVAKESLPPDTE
uniref:Uncharacterized protein n=1 Tax=Amphora coffeiformis TaxID=265554 RepID=A0A7S3P7Z0_9STRA|mmetsp:Transcript_10112/g.19450  ORF Transcript_10112/g.19450 Transcript_10112/m.19450 type:complete len:106 (-) Transcript_10112:9-326(-)|eukprot:scaffold10022_cov170-Amphora_coffeaeformis.AAC.11